MTVNGDGYVQMIERKGRRKTTELDNENRFQQHVVPTFAISCRSLVGLPTASRLILESITSHWQLFLSSNLQMQVACLQVATVFGATLRFS